MKINIFTVGKFDKFYDSAIKEYEKRLSKYCKISLSQFKNPEALIKKLPTDSYMILCNELGTNISSEELAEKIETLALTGKSTMTIVLGQHDIQWDEHISLSKMTMDEGLSTTILFEQVYRAYRIIHGHAYHK